MTSLPQLLPQLAGCTLCPLHSGVRSRGLPTRHLPTSLPPHPSNPCLLVVGMAPHTVEDMVGRSWSGKSGALLERGYLEHLLPVACIYLANVARCMTPTGRPRSAEYRACRPHLMADAASICAHHRAAPVRAMLCAGADPLAWAAHGPGRPARRLTQPEGFACQGFQHPTLDMLVFTTYHPAALLRSPRLAAAVKRHMQTLENALRRTLPPVPTDPTIVPSRHPRAAPIVRRPAAQEPST